MAALLLAPLIAIGVDGRVHGQSTPPSEPLAVEGPVQYVGPDTYILLDAEGRAQPVLGMRYEEFVAAWKKAQQLEAQATEPRYALEEMAVDGRRRDDHAEVEVKLTVRLLSGEALRVPLGMAGAILREAPRWDRAEASPADLGGAISEPRLYYDATLGGFVADLKGRVDERLSVTLPMMFPLVRDGDEATLQLNFPRALVGRLTLDVPTSVIEAATNEGSLVTRSATDGGGSRMIVDGLTGDFRLSWKTAESRRSELATVLSATSEIAVAIDGHSVRTDAKLSVASFGGSYERFRVRLPPGARLIQNRSSDAPAAAPAYRVTVENATASDGAEDDQIVLVEFSERQRGPVTVILSTEQPLGFPNEDLAVELAGFEVVDAVRQFGDVAIHVTDDWQLRWQIGPHVRQVDRSDLAPALEAKQPNVAFQFDRQPWSLRALVTARPLRIHVAPSYTLNIEPDEALLRAQLTYQVPGARAFEFRVGLNGWELTADPIESNGLVDRDGVVVTRDGLLVLPLAQASSRRAEIAFWVRRALPRDGARFEVPLLAPEADSVAAAELAVSAGQGLELLPDMARSRGLSPTPISGERPAPTGAAGGPAFVYRSLLPEPVFAAERTVLAQQIDANIATDLQLAGRQVDAVQTVDYSVRFQPLDRIALEVPAGWSIVDGEVEIVSSSGEGSSRRSSTSPQRLAVPIASELGDADDERHTVEIAMPQPRLGQFRTRVRYRLTGSADVPGTGDVVLSLPAPSGVQIVESRVRLVSPEGASASLDPTVDPPEWRAVAVPGAIHARGTTELVASGRQPRLPLLLQPIARELPQATVVEQVWLQMWRAGNTIQDRAAFRIRTAGQTATIELPPLVLAESVEVLVDRELAEDVARERGRLVVGLPPAEDAAAQSHTLEVRYRRAATQGIVTREAFTPPQLVGSSAMNEVYWHVVLPGDMHIVRAPPQLVPISRWQWLATFWGRQPTKTQSELEAWIQAASHAAPEVGQSEYLYNGLAPVASIEIVTSPRWLIVLAASSAVLAIALLWMHLPAVRRPWIALAVAVALAGLAVAFPGPALLLAQASVLGWIAATVAVALRRRTSDSTVRVPATAGGSTNLRIRPLSRPESVITPALPTASGTPTAPLGAPEVDR